MIGVGVHKGLGRTKMKCSLGVQGPSWRAEMNSAICSNCRFHTKLKVGIGCNSSEKFIQEGLQDHRNAVNVQGSMKACGIYWREKWHEIHQFSYDLLGTCTLQVYYMLFSVDPSPNSRGSCDFHCKLLYVFKVVPQTERQNSARESINVRWSISRLH